MELEIGMGSTISKYIFKIKIYFCIVTYFVKVLTTGARPTLKCNIVNRIIKPESRTCPYFSDCYHLGRVLLHYHNNLMHFSISQSLLGSEHEELHYRYNLTVLHGKSEYTYKGPVISMIKNATDIKNEGRCLVIREKVWDYMSYKLKITKH